MKQCRPQREEHLHVWHRTLASGNNVLVMVNTLLPSRNVVWRSKPSREDLEEVSNWRPWETEAHVRFEDWQWAD